MTVNEFERLYSTYGTRIQVKSGFNNKILCKRFDKNKHLEIGERQVVSIIPEISLNHDRTFAYPFITLYADGEKECNEYFQSKRGESDND